MESVLTPGSSESHPPARAWLLPAALLLLLFAVWLEPAGSHLAEPDETRYAEIPREMLASGDLLTPRLNGVPYLEKPPLLYWATATAFRLFGETPWAARLPARLAAMGTVALLFFATKGLRGRESRFAAAIFFLAAPLSFALARVDVTDGLLTFFFTATLLAARATIRRYEERRSTLFLSAWTGLAAAGAVLTKGAVGVVLPGVILLLWCLATGRLASLKPLLLGPAVAVFVLLSAPWFLLLERRHPGFLHFFFIREHFARFTSPGHEREGPVFYFLLVFLAGFLPGLPFLVSALRHSGRLSAWRRERSEELLFVLWLVVVIAFFSLSRSKLAPYILPAFSAAAALAAGAFAEGRSPSRRIWLLHAVLVTLIVFGAALHPQVRSWTADYDLLPLAWTAGLTLAVGAWTAFAISRRSSSRALSALAAGWAASYVSLVLAWPSLPAAVDVHGLARLTREVADRTSAQVVFHKTFLNGVVWELKHPVPASGYRGELKPDVPPLARADPERFWPEDRFWKTWSSGKPLLAIVRGRDLESFGERGGGYVLGKGRGHFLISNFPLDPPRVDNFVTSALLYDAGDNRSAIPIRSVPAPALERARRESGGDRLVWATQEREDGKVAYELVTGARRPRAFQVSASGELLSVEEEINPRRLPRPVLDAVLRVSPGARVAFATRESHRSSGPSVLFEVYLPEGNGLRELAFEPSGRPYREEEPAS